MQTSKAVIDSKSPPQSWTSVKLQDIGATISGLTGKKKNDFGLGAPYVTYKNVYLNSFVDENILELVSVGPSEKQAKLKKGDILFTTSSENPEEVGMSSVLLSEPVSNTYLNSFCFGFRLNNLDTIDSVFSGYFFRGSLFRKKMETHAKGTTRFNLSKSDFLKTQISLPPLTSQRRIAEVLSAVDKAISLTDKTLSEAVLLKTALSQDLFTKGVCHAPLRQTDFGNIPDGWELVTMRDICTVSQGLQIPISKRFKEAGPNRYKYLTIRYLSDKTKPAEYIESPKSNVICKEDDLLMTRTGKTGEVITGETGVFHNNFFLMDYDRSKVDRWFMYYYLKSNRIQNILKIRAGTTTIPDLNHGDFYSIPFVLPTLEEQKKIASILLTLDEKISVNRKLIASQQRLKKGLMQDLLTGKVQV